MYSIGVWHGVGILNGPGSMEAAKGADFAKFPRISWRPGIPIPTEIGSGSPVLAISRILRNFHRNPGISGAELFTAYPPLRVEAESRKLAEFAPNAVIFLRGAFHSVPPP